jgi:HSP20 family protein
MLVRFERFPMAHATWRSAAEFERDIDSLFKGYMSADSGCVQPPAMNIIELKDESVVTVELPGVAKEDVKLSLDDELLTIKGERKSSQLPEGARWIRSERRSGEFFRSIQLPHPVKAEGITAELANGILRIAIPKAEEARPREIAVK